MWRTSGDSGFSAGGGVAHGATPEDASVDDASPSERAALHDLPGGADQNRAVWLAVAGDLGLSRQTVATLSHRSRQIGTSLGAEILAMPDVDETDFYLAIGRTIGVAICCRLEPQRLHLNARQAAMLLGSPGENYPIRYSGDSGAAAYLTSPDPCRIDDLINRVAAFPDIRSRLVLVPRGVMRATLAMIAQPALIARARDTLFLSTPLYSARTLANGWQGVLLGVVMISLVFGMLLQQSATVRTIHLVATLSYLAGIGLRLLAIPAYSRPPVPPFGPRLPKVPIYTVLVALRNEAAVVPELLVSLGRINWPRSRLEIKFVCETEDRKTIEAVRAGGLRPWVEVIEVPNGMLKTKPNALSFALPQTSGEFLVLYDAEDRPGPDQLVEAWRRFSGSDQQLACLQAPLRIDNWRQGILPRMFALEFASLFMRMLPMLARFNLVLPLGGTSNHFRRAALDHVGAWDPYNVTEDADLGIRLARLGYRSGVLQEATGEDAPDTFGVWLKQRSRWMKGWMHTLLVHTRQPARLVSGLGIGPATILLLLMGGIVISTMLHPLVWVAAIWLAALYLAGLPSTPMDSAMFVLDALSVVLGYLVFLLLGWIALGKTPARKGFWKVVVFTPVYWLMLSLAAWRAFFQLITDPHKWEKTPHKPRRRFAVGLERNRKLPGYADRKPGPSPITFGSSAPTTSPSRPL